MTMSVTRVLRAVASSSSAPEWGDAEPTIAEERRMVDHSLQRDDAPGIYGFTTYLGQLDHQRAEPEDQQILLENHLVGPTTNADEKFIGLLTACKLQQLHHGGTGIHPATYRALVQAEARPAYGCWSGSYGAGDVVPAAWWARSVLRSAPGTSESTWRPGDFIALVNGDFVSTTWGIIAAVDFICSAAAVLARYADHAVNPWGGARASTDQTIMGLLSRFERVPAGETQLPVSLRDALPLVQAIVDVLKRWSLTLNDRLEAPSGNPLFLPTGEDGVPQLAPISQASFLGPQLTFEQTNALQLTHMMAGVVQRMIAHQVRDTWSTGAAAKVQPPKVAEAYLERMRLNFTGLSSRFTGHESEGIEDFWDLSTLSAEQLLGALGELPGLLHILDSLSVSESRAKALQQRERDFRGILGSVLLPNLTSDEIHRLLGLKFL